MIKTSNSKCRQYVQELKPFKANNLSADWEGNYYVVKSYNWYPLFAYHREAGKWFENADKYSVSTSKQRGQAHPLVDTVPLSKEGIRDLLGGR